MKFISKLVLLLAALPFASFVSCNKEEGEGGKAKISGIVYKVIDGGDISKDGNNYGFVRDTVVASDVDVYIIYGENEENVYNDKTKTSHNGRFEFDYLRAGNYLIYAYNDNDSYVMRKVHCDKTEIAGVEPMYILEGKNSGKCGIVGDVQIKYSATEGLVSAVATRVYIRKFGQMSVSDTRTDDNGNYYFSRLDPNTNYIVWVEKEVEKNGQIIAVADTVLTGEAGTITKSDVLKAKVY